MKYFKNFFFCLVITFLLPACKKGIPILTGGTPPTPTPARIVSNISNGVGVSTSGANPCGGLGQPCKIKARVGLQQWDSANQASFTEAGRTYKIKGTLSYKTE